MFISLAAGYAILAFLPNVYSQGTPESCQSFETCVIIKQCPSLTTQEERRNAQKCGVQKERRGQRPMICCPGKVLPTPDRPRQSLSSRRSRPAAAGWKNSQECGKPRVYGKETFVMGGRIALPGQFPWLVTITMPEQGHHVPSCTGFLITDRHVVTAAHCFPDPKNVRNYEVRIGNSTDWRERKRYPVQFIKNHEGYRDERSYDDISVVTLKEAVRDPSTNVICLPDTRIRSNLVGKGTTVAGWGADEYKGRLSNVLMYLDDLKVVSNDECDRIFRKELLDYRQNFPQGVTPGLICAGHLAGGKDACQGDSGGPLMFLTRRGRWYVVGVVSFGKGCGEKGLVGGYTRVSGYVDWIRRNTQ